jgi:multicomponent Na+:H+ antiporter subunit E
MRARIELFVLLLAFWLLLSDERTPLMLGIGVVSAAGITWLTGGFFARVAATASPLRTAPLRAWRTARYSVWLLGRVMAASVEVAWLVIHPRLPIEPGFVRFRTSLRSPLARTTLANSITLVPGTLTVRVEGDEFLVHALHPSSAEDLRTGAMQRRVAHVFLEPHEEGPVATDWEPAGGER